MPYSVIIKKLLLIGDGTNTETHNFTTGKCAENERPSALSPKQNVSMTLPHSGLREFCKSRNGKIIRGSADGRH